MNNYSKLITSHMISFKEVLVKNYKRIKLNEIEAMVIILLYEQRKHNNEALSVKTLLPFVTLSENELSKLIVNLVERGYIYLTFDNDATEKFSLEPTIERLGECLAVEHSNEKNESSLEVSQVVTLIENSFQKQLSPSDIIYVQKWVNENYSYDQIRNAVLESLKLKKMNIKYVDAVLIGRSKRETATNVDPKLEEVLQQINVRRR